MNSQKKGTLWAMRHTGEHLLHQSVKELFPEIKLAMGPATPEGFYFDFDPGKVKITPEDFPKIESRMEELKKLDLPMIREEISVKEARELFKGNPYKQEWIDGIEERQEKVTTYRTGKEGDKNSMVDLCAGPHAKTTGEVGPFKLLSIAGAYWRGDEKNKMLTRIYGTAFPTQKELDKYIWREEEAKKRDHRKIGREMELFTIRDEVGPGLAIWLPKGNIIREELEAWAKKTEKAWGYKSVATPHITKANLYYTSGHLPYYKDDMFPPMVLDESKEEYYLKPMNCPHHHMVYSDRPKSYRDLPLRIAEFGYCYRYEASGELFGLMRVRGFEQNDAHIYCTKDQAVEEFVKVMKLHEYYYKALGIKDYYLELALRDPANKTKYHGNEAMWKEAESLMREAVAQVDIPMVEEDGSAAFYGPKIDFVVKSSIGREFATSTNQIDLFMGDRFKLKYTDDKGIEQTPVIIHRAPLGSHERFIGFLIEHFAGAFPVWLHPVQVMIIPISAKQLDYAKGVEEKLISLIPELRVELDNSDETLGNKIRKAQTQKAPYMLIVGDKEVENNSVSLRLRDGKDGGVIKVEEFADKVSKIILNKDLELGFN
ncbi:threonine--tRNA ligase [Candidatus Roizmanbacteria bacterium CG22_combo_CG10-13_8_21_14_all_38_20]|uniref:Threonine--tRNA ligase n=1 Tax=Candidatus Roizmanbacteria bacterium CG22_combo_CG10-13_8_21_14_all_38_20 TaxID=1974862 RepID=A0A2H0BXA6_9BACT|nr:threonine--tRNA ligase [Candidatus Microgenomates bacterium]PIP61608.1 MAG: threonine--tRNA ligase [Candidatus Roizmanbacteria bacterium CG22_combo_CG10-13_8_21_14_all_38_20]PJC30570.1 MAG: threonine--tRNA ligase [Candidatus Roizmanbacteria bacterium CG_4_9_14_0_2_um_filter_38_17]